MIFVILGTQKFQLNRLLKLIDEEIEKGRLTESVFAQIGNSNYIPQNYEWVKFLDKDKFEQKINESDIVITHSGVGSIITAINSQKPVIVFPRLKEYKEHVDDHQLEIAEAFAKKEFIVKYRDDVSLCEQIINAKNFKYKKYDTGREQIIYLIDEFIRSNNQ